MTTNVTPARAKVWETTAVYLLLAWVALGAVFFVTQFSYLTASAITVWLVVFAVLTTVKIWLQVRRS